MYLNGRILPEQEAAISPFDIGLLRAYAVFDLLRTVNGAPFMLTEHLRRFRLSAAHLGLVVPVADDAVFSAVDELLRINEHREATIRMVLTGGVSPDGMSFDPSTPTFFILTHELHEPPASTYTEGARLLIREHSRELPEAKTTGYLTALKNRPAVVEVGALDLLYHDGGVISEAATASFYLVRDGEIHAPSEGVLWGTVGSFALGLVRDRYDIVPGPMTLDDAFSAEEAFLTSTTRGVVPIVRLDDRPIGDGRVGPVTKDLMAAFRAAAFGDPESGEAGSGE
jgi:branched-subunit amino acid aminotransferase/4-amino-4-deoxychorismate lyase